MPRICIGCGNEIHPKRVEILPNTKTCVNCSTTEKKGGMIMQLGEGDHTYTEVIVMDREELNIIEDITTSHKKISNGKIKKETLLEEDIDDELSDLRIVEGESTSEDENDEELNDDEEPFELIED